MSFLARPMSSDADSGERLGRGTLSQSVMKRFQSSRPAQMCGSVFRTLSNCCEWLLP